MRYDLRGKFVCGKCFGDEGLVDYCLSYGQRKKCDFCRTRSDDRIAAPLYEVLDHVKECVFKEYDNPDNAGLPYESAEGGYQGTTYDTEEVLESLDLDFRRDKTNTLRDIVINSLGNDLWSDAEPFRLTAQQHLDYGWDHFCEVIKHERRYFFFQIGSGTADPEEELDTPAEILRRIFDYAEEVGAFVTMPAGTRLYRARFQPIGKGYRTAGELGPPPAEFATQTNRMSPPGIVMTYVSEDRATALAETVSGRGTYAIGEFLTERPALILDLSNLPSTPSIFAEIPDSYPYNPRPRIGFLQNVSREISRSIARDDRVHVEYVPTQVVTEYVRAVLTIDGRNVDGIRFQSSRNRKKTAMVLFANRDNLVLEKGEQGEWYALNRDRWLRLDKASSKRVLKLPT